MSIRNLKKKPTRPNKCNIWRCHSPVAGDMSLLSSGIGWPWRRRYFGTSNIRWNVSELSLLPTRTLRWLRIKTDCADHTFSVVIQKLLSDLTTLTVPIRTEVFWITISCSHLSEQRRAPVPVDWCSTFHQRDYSHPPDYTVPTPRRTQYRLSFTAGETNFRRVAIRHKLAPETKLSTVSNMTQIDTGNKTLSRWNMTQIDTGNETLSRWNMTQIGTGNKTLYS